MNNSPVAFARSVIDADVPFYLVRMHKSAVLRQLGCGHILLQ